MVCIREAKYKAFIAAIKNGLLIIKKGTKDTRPKLSVNREFQDYDGVGLDPADVKNHEIELYQLESHLRKIVDAYVKEIETSAKKGKR